MADDVVSIKVTADMSGLQGQLLIAQQNMRDTAAQAKAMAKAFVDTGVVTQESAAKFAALNTATLEYAATVEAVKAQLADLTAAQTASAAATTEAAAATTAAGAAMKVNVSGFHEVIVVADEAMRGNFSRIPGSLTVMANRFNLLTPATLGWAAAIGAVGVGLYELIKNIIETEKEMNAIQGQMDLFGRTVQTQGTGIEDWGQMLTQMYGASSSEANKLIASSAGVREATASQQVALTQLASEMEGVSKGTLTSKSAMDALGKAVDGGAKSMVSMGDKFGFLTLAQADAISGFEKTGDAQDAVNVFTKAGIDYYNQQALAIKQNADNLKLYNAQVALSATSGGAAPLPPTEAQEPGINRNQPSVADQETARKFLDDGIRAQQEATDKEVADAKRGADADMTERRKAAEAAKEAAREVTQADEQQWSHFKEMLAQGREAIKQNDAENKAAAASIEEADASQAKAGYDAVKDALDAEVAARKITVAQEIAELKKMEQAQFEAAIAAKAAELQGTDDPATIAKIHSQIEQLEAQHNKTMLGLDKQLADDQKKTAQQTEREWSQATKFIGTAFAGMLRGVLTGTETWQQAEHRLLQNLALSAIESTAEWAADWAAKKALALAVEEATNLGIISSQTAAAITGKGIQTAAAASTVLSDAAVASAASYASVSAIPIVGWAMAPGVAAAAFAAVAAMAPATSAAGGMYEVPNEMSALIHPQESIIPASVANPMRDFFEGGASGGAGGGNSVAITVQAIDQKSLIQALNAPSVQRALTRNLFQYGQNNPSTQMAGP